MPGRKDRLTDAGYGLGWSVVCRLPQSWAHSAFRFGADLARPATANPRTTSDHG
jgi:hypothetical protein